MVDKAARFFFFFGGKIESTLTDNRYALALNKILHLDWGQKIMLYLEE